jgi:hypothetical protein
MQQQVNASILITFSADAELSREQLASEIATAIGGIFDRDDGQPLEVQSWKLERLQEEAAIYSEEPASFAFESGPDKMKCTLRDYGLSFSGTGPRGGWVGGPCIDRRDLPRLAELLARGGYVAACNTAGELEREDA